jgi:mitogen-activated protein kinase 15
MLLFSGNLQHIHIEFITWQLLAALKFVHSASVVHRDVKPPNILLNAKCSVRLCDFGMARSVVARDPDRYGPLPRDYKSPASSVVRLTNYCSSRWYRSPEQLMNARNYGTAIDMWSLGCVVGEMIQRKPIFPGTCTLMQLSMIVHLTGRPPDIDLAGINSKYVVQILEGLGNSKQGKISDIIPNGSREAQDFIHVCLQFNPDKRITASEALSHPFIGHFHNPDAEPSHPTAEVGGISLPLCDDVQYSVNAYRDQIYADFIGNEKVKDRMNRDRLIRENHSRGDEDLNNHFGKSKEFN